MLPTTPLDLNDPAVLALLSDLQGNILKSHGRDHVRVVLLRFKPSVGRTDPEVKVARNRNRALVRSIAGRLKSMMVQFREAEALSAHNQKGTVFWGFSLSFDGYDELGLSDGLDTGRRTFKAGMAVRAAKLGDDFDVLKGVGDWQATYVESWHAAILVADDNDGGVDVVENSFAALRSSPEWSAAVGQYHEENGKVLRNAFKDRIEPFGYVDGRSEPLFFQRDLDGEKPRRAPAEPEVWSSLTALDRVLVPVKDGAGNPAGYGSFFVFRKLEQDVAGFDAATDQLAQVLDPANPDPVMAGAKIVGRFKDGTPLATSNKPTVTGLDQVPNNFNYGGDENLGVKCPFHAHVRKANPRGSSGDPVDERSRLFVRRGIPYDQAVLRPDGTRDPATRERGLLFMAYMADIAEQFELMQIKWFGLTTFPDPSALDIASSRSALDPLVGPATLAAKLKCPVTWGDAATGRKAFDFQRFVTARGGEYFLTPPIGLLKNLPDL